jgi:uncharacterized protein YndB with AHSA1/START domain
MAKIERSIIIDAPVEAVFSYVEDPANLPEYWPSVIEVKAVEQLPNGGARMTIAYKMAGVRCDIETACTEYVPNQRSVYESEGPVSSTVTWTYETHDGGTRATVANEHTVQLPVLRKLGESFLTKIGENEAEAILGNVKAKMEA